MSPLQPVAEQANAYHQQYSAGQLTVEDFKELVNDLNIGAQIQQQSDDLVADEMYRQILIGVYQAASALVS